ncbi:MAG: LamG-like jellyroll fold domain-containing protein [Armatimonadota bacterium]
MSTRRLSYLILVACVLAVGLTGAARGADYTIPIDTAISQATPWPGSITIPLTDPVTKSNYWTTVNVFYTPLRSNAVYWTAQATPYLNISLYLNYGMWIARMYAITGQAADAELAADCVEYAKRCMVEYPSNPACQPGADAPHILWKIHTCLTGSSYYTTTHQQWVRDMAVDAFPSYAGGGGWGKEYGSFNRSFGCALNAQCLLALVPTAPDASQWQTYIDTVWNYWWTYKDNDESTDHYNGLWFRYLLQWIEVRNCQTTFWSNAGVKRMMDRYLYQVLPMGSFPHYGDSCGWNVSWGHWIHVFEACATAYNDPRYKWAAHRIYNYGINRIENLTSWAYTGEEAGWSMLNAWSAANDGIAEGPREKDVALTKRHRIVQRTTQQQQQTNQYFDLYSEMQPDKMVFTSGPDRDSLSMMLDAVGEAGHSHKKSPMTIALCDKQSLLLMALGYMDRLPEEHDRPLVMDFDGYPYDSTEYHIKSNNDLVSQANVYELGGVGYGKIQVTQYLGYPANMDRDVIFIKGVGAIVKDMVTFTSLTGATDIWLRWGSMYRVANLGPDYGSNWANTYIGEWIPLRGLGVNAPVYTRWKNSKRDLFIYFLENDNGTMEVVDHKQWDSTLPLPWRLQYSIRQTTQANTPVSSTTLLLPHASGAAQSLANGVTVNLDEALKTVFSFTGEDGALHSVIFNRSGAAVSAGGLATDGQIAYVKRVSGTVTGTALYGGTYITVDGVDKTSLAAAAIEQMVPEALTDVQVALTPPPPVTAQTPITITATPVGGTMVQYQFQLQTDGGSWTTLQAYSSSNTCVWTPLEWHDYTIRVWAKEGDSTNQYDVQKDVPFQLAEPPDAWWKFDDGSGTSAADSSGNGNTGTLRNSPTWATGHSGGALSFNGLNSLVSVPNVEMLKYRGGDLTLNCWININSSETTGGYLVCKPWNGNGQYNYWLSLDTNKKVVFGLQMGFTGNKTITAPTGLSPSTWYQLVATADSQKNMVLTVYDANGSVVTSASGTHTNICWTPKHEINGGFAIGTLYPYGQGWGGSTSFTFDGLIDDVQVTIKPIQDARWKLDDGSGTSAADSTGNGNTGTLRNSPTWTTGFDGGALLFNGLNSLVSVPNVEALKYRGGDLSLDCWININATETTGGYLVCKPWSGSGQYNYWLSLDASKRMVFGLQMGFPSIKTITAPTGLSTSTWYHVVATVDAQKNMSLTVYDASGTVVTSATGVHTVTDWTPTTEVNGGFAIGSLFPYGEGWGGSAGFTFDGMIDDVQLTITPP